MSGINGPKGPYYDDDGGDIEPLDGQPALAQGAPAYLEAAHLDIKLAPGQHFDVVFPNQAYAFTVVSSPSAKIVIYRKDNQSAMPVILDSISQSRVTLGSNFFGGGFASCLVTCDPTGNQENVHIKVGSTTLEVESGEQPRVMAMHAGQVGSDHDVLEAAEGLISTDPGDLPATSVAVSAMKDPFGEEDTATIPIEVASGREMLLSPQGGQFIELTSAGLQIGSIRMVGGQPAFYNSDYGMTFPLNPNGATHIGRKHQVPFFFGDRADSISREQLVVKVRPHGTGFAVEIDNLSTTYPTSREYRDPRLMRAAGLHQPEFLPHTIAFNTTFGAMSPDGKFAMRTAQLSRPSNQDAVYMNPAASMIALADGMGGYSDGDIASTSALQAIHHFVRNARINKAATTTAELFFQTALLALQQVYNANLMRDPSSGITMAIARKVESGDKLYAQVAHVANTKVLIIAQDGTVPYESKDKTYVQTFIDAGALTRLEALTSAHRGIVVNPIRPKDKDTSPDIKHIACEPGDTVILLSDGVTDVVSPYEIAQLTTSPDHNGKPLMDRIIELAASRQGKTDFAIQFGPDDFERVSVEKPFFDNASVATMVM